MLYVLLTTSLGWSSPIEEDWPVVVLCVVEQDAPNADAVQLPVVWRPEPRQFEEGGEEVHLRGGLPGDDARRHPAGPPGQGRGAEAALERRLLPAEERTVATS